MVNSTPVPRQCVRRVKTYPRPENRVWGFRAKPSRTHRVSGPRSLQPRRENRPAPTKIASGVRFYGYRYYDPVTGRWPSRDPIGERGGTNLYGFVGNDGLNSYDFNGLWSCDACKKALEDAKKRHAKSLAKMKKDGCLINMYCVCREKGDKGTSAGDFEGYKSWVRKKPTGGRIRVYCTEREAPYGLYFDHEMIHAEQWCGGDTGGDCETVIMRQGEALQTC